eukprot:CAMPEP_0197078466 /NCGR_PEP_ID=MMETSP1384-20130603/213132_1 /TAXON_ID=29189 /ORGANISM="Ammonia sp." /LENGTH=567 /DNA_ID=CAMNT_0042517333 /DNA_START=298 /DNA_END=2001 /DNA_ORIENTATION=-
MTSTLHCNGNQSCSLLGIYFSGNTNADQCSVFADNTNAFKHAYFDCTNNGQCNLHCDNQAGTECNNAILDCNHLNSTQCKCTSSGCAAQNVHVYYNAITTTESSLSTTATNRVIVSNSTASLHAITTTESSLSTTATNRVIASNSTASLLDSDTLKYVLITLVVVVILCGCGMFVCCWKFEAIYDCYERKKQRPKLRQVASKSDAQAQVQYNGIAGVHASKPSATISDDRPPPIDVKVVHHASNESHAINEQGRTSTVSQMTLTESTTNDRHKYPATETETETQQHVQRTAANSIDISRERLPSSWYKYQEHKQQSADLDTVVSPLTALTQTTVISALSDANPQHLAQNHERRETSMSSRSMSKHEPSERQPAEYLEEEEERNAWKRKRREKRRTSKQTESEMEDETMPQNKKPQKQNKKRQKSEQVKRVKTEKKERHHHKVKKQQVEYRVVARKHDKAKEVAQEDEYKVAGHEDEEEDDTESTSSSDELTESETDSDSASSTTTTSHSTDAEESEEDAKEAEGDETTMQTGNVDDMLVNMVMMMQNTPNDSNQAVQSLKSFPATYK